MAKSVAEGGHVARGERLEIGNGSIRDRVEGESVN